MNDKTDFSIHPQTKISAVILAVTDLESQVQFYQQLLGFHILTQDKETASLGTEDQVLVQLEQHPSLQRIQRVTGLYHLAVLFPNQGELARAVARLLAQRYPIAPTDHIMTKAIYLNDPEGNGIELYAESPEDGVWFLEESNFFARRSDGSISNGREPLDLDALLSKFPAGEPVDTPIPSDTCIGHIHLHVNHIQKALDFYHGILGFDIMGSVSAYQMAFVSAGGYHHHIGLNTWQGIDAPPPPANALGLRYFSIALPNQETLDTRIARITAANIPLEPRGSGILLHDPAQNGILLRVEEGKTLEPGLRGYIR